MKVPHSKRQIWVILFGVIITVWLLKKFCIESYSVSTGQMEQGLLQGEQIFVTKWNYGFRLPQTPFALPFFHDSVRSLQIRSYWNSLSIPLIQLKPSVPDRYSIVLFNHPQPEFQDIPVDRRKICISRCIGLPGDSISINNGIVSINGTKIPDKDSYTNAYLYESKKEQLILTAMQKCGITDRQKDFIGSERLCFFSDKEKKLLDRYLGDSLLNPVTIGLGNINITIPKPGKPTRLTNENIPYLYPVIKQHENRNAILSADGKVYIDGKQKDFFIFKNTYYFMLSDNRALGYDSRAFGLVPQSHLIGKPFCTWFSAEPHKSLFTTIRYNRLFRKIE